MKDPKTRVSLPIFCHQELTKRTVHSALRGFILTIMGLNKFNFRPRDLIGLFHNVAQYQQIFVNFQNSELKGVQNLYLFTPLHLKSSLGLETSAVLHANSHAFNMRESHACVTHSDQFLTPK